MTRKSVLTFREASELGLIQKLNREVLHPMGLALCWNPETNLSEGFLVSEEGEWKYDDSVVVKPFDPKALEAALELPKPVGAMPVQIGG